MRTSATEKQLSPCNKPTPASEQWFENVSRYVDLDPQTLLALLLDRRSPLLPRIPPRSYYRLYRGLVAHWFAESAGGPRRGSSSSTTR
jgi:hypothetical protein